MTFGISGIFKCARESWAQKKEKTNRRRRGHPPQMAHIRWGAKWRERREKKETWVKVFYLNLNFTIKTSKKALNFYASFFVVAVAVVVAAAATYSTPQRSIDTLCWKKFAWWRSYPGDRLKLLKSDTRNFPKIIFIYIKCGGEFLNSLIPQPRAPPLQPITDRRPRAEMTKNVIPCWMI